MQRANAIYNCKNPFQGKEKRILCICSAGLLRSPTLAGELYSRGYNSRSAGVHDYALILADEVLLEWADIVIFVQKGLEVMIPEGMLDGKKVITLDIPDAYEFRQEGLVRKINDIIDEMEEHGDLAD